MKFRNVLTAIKLSKMELSWSCTVIDCNRLGLQKSSWVSLYIRPEGDFPNEIYEVERTNKAEIRLEEQSEKRESNWENLLNEIQLKSP